MPELIITAIFFYGVGISAGLTVAAAVFFAVVATAALTAHQRRVARRGTAPLDYNSIREFGIGSNPPRQEFFGTAWVGPQYVYGANTASKSGGGYHLLTCLADHDIKEILDVKVNGNSFCNTEELIALSNNEPVQMLTSRASDSFKGNTDSSVLNQNRDGEFALPLDSVGFIVQQQFNESRSDGSRPTVRADADDRADDAGWDFSMEILPHLNQRRPSVKPDLSNVTNPLALAFLQLIYAGTNIVRRNIPVYFHEVLDSYRDTGSGPARRWNPPEEYESWAEAQARGTGVSMMGFFIPVVTDPAEEPIFSPVPNISLLMRRDKSTLKLWDPNVEGNPPIHDEWSDANAALCAYHVANTLSPYRNVDGEEPSIDVQSAYAAAVYCHEHSLECNGGFLHNTSITDIFSQLELAMGGGAIVDRGGTLYIHAGQYTLPTLTFTDEEIIDGSWNLQTIQERAVRKASTSVEYIDIEGDDQESIFVNNLAVEQGENLNSESTQALFINNEPQARRISYLMNARAWQSSSVTFSLRAGQPSPNVWDVIRVRLDAIGFDGEFRVDDVKHDLHTDIITVEGSTVDSRWYDNPAESDVLPAPRPLIGSGRSNAIDLLELDDDCNLIVDDTDDTVLLRIN